MPTAEKILAFFSYAHADWQADTATLDHLFTQLERQIQALTAGSFAFEKWLDRERLTWGKDWEKVLLEDVNDSELFFIFLSPAWLASKVCRQEFEAFLGRQKALGGERVFVAHIRDLDQDDKDRHHDVLADLERLQSKLWHGILTAEEKDRKKACADAATEVKKRLRALGTERKPPQAQPKPQSNSIRRHNSAPPVSGLPLVEGAFFIPPALQGGEVDGVVLACLRVVFCGWAKVTINSGCFTLGVKSALLSIRADGGRLSPHPEFPGVDCPSTIKPKGLKTYQIAALTTDPTDVLDGNVLSNRDTEIPIMQIERQNGNPVKVSGTIDIDPDSLTIDYKNSEPKRRANHPDGSDKMKKMIQGITRAVLQEHGLRFTLESAEQ